MLFTSTSSIQRRTSARWTVWSITAPPPASSGSRNHPPGIWPWFVPFRANTRPRAPSRTSSRADHGGEVAHREGRPELAFRVLGGLDHDPGVLDGARDGLLTEHVHATPESRDHIPRVVPVLRT